MCTVSIVPLAGGCRVVCNRDERRTRAAAHPPRAFPTEVSWATYPQDPVSGGTWIGVNDEGLVVALLNRTATGSGPRQSPHSRGSIVPVMFTSSSLGDAVVETPRRRLFDELVLAGADWLHGQFRFHRHQWDKRPEISVQMAREDAATVSRTTIAVTSKTIDLEYESLIGAVQTASAAGCVPC